MAIKHVIRKDGTGKTRMVSLTPLRAIRFQCIECMGMQQNLVRGCSSPLCPLYPFRTGTASRKGH